MSNVYYNPEDHELELVSALNQPDMDYSYNTLIVLKHKPTNRLFYAQDSGCSCPTPFDDYRFSADESGVINTNLNEITEASKNSFQNAVDEFPVSMEERQECLTTVRRLLFNKIFKD